MDPPDVPTSLPPAPATRIEEKWLLDEEDDIEVTQLVNEEVDASQQSPCQTASELRLQADIEILLDQQPLAGAEANDEKCSSNLLQPTRVPKRRRSPITVQEWVASLPVHHLIQREE